MLFENGAEREFDVIVFATGYRSIANNWMKVKYFPNSTLSFSKFSSFSDTYLGFVWFVENNYRENILQKMTFENTFYEKKKKREKRNKQQ